MLPGWDGSGCSVKSHLAGGRNPDKQNGNVGFHNAEFTEVQGMGAGLGLALRIRGCPGNAS